ncbi:hypothetical protein C8Q70DRAFT_663640 [Cubamyces menziesii]|nr:hypothetical protein C8Q70DRAFT_663640 [Cubamyces menziesii]
MQRRPSSQSDAPHPLPRSVLAPCGLFSASLARVLRVDRSERVPRPSSVQTLASPLLAGPLCTHNTSSNSHSLPLPSSFLFLVQRDAAWPAYLTSGRIGEVISTRTSSAHGPSHAPSSRWRRPDQPRRPSQPRVQSLIRVSYTSFRATRPPLDQGTPSASFGFPVSIHNPTYRVLHPDSRCARVPHSLLILYVHLLPIRARILTGDTRNHHPCTTLSIFRRPARTRSEHLNSAPPLATPLAAVHTPCWFHGSRPTTSTI